MNRNYSEEYYDQKVYMAEVGRRAQASHRWVRRQFPTNVLSRCNFTRPFIVWDNLRTDRRLAFEIITRLIANSLFLHGMNVGERNGWKFQTLLTAQKKTGSPRGWCHRHHTPPLSLSLPGAHTQHTPQKTATDDRFDFRQHPILCDCCVECEDSWTEI
jgi:hypothetical protein